MELGSRVQRPRAGTRVGRQRTRSVPRALDHQDAAGAPPDSITHLEIPYNYVKPPIHGWALLKLRERLERPLDSAELREVYDRLSRWNNFWLDYRRVSGRDLPPTTSTATTPAGTTLTTFDLDRVIESPDLAAFLVVQLDVLAEARCGSWGSRSRGGGRVGAHPEALLSQLWDGENFVAVGRDIRPHEHGDEPAQPAAGRGR